IGIHYFRTLVSWATKVVFRQLESFNVEGKVPIVCPEWPMSSTIDRRCFLKFSSLAPLAACLPATAFGQPPTKKMGLVLGQPEGAAAGMEVLAAGGNAVDAAVTAALVAGVVAVPMCGIGGYGGHMVIARPDAKVSAIDFNTEAPSAAKPEMFPLDDKE